VPAGAIGPVPFGVQLTATRYADGWLLDLAEQWETARPWPRHPPGYAPFAVTTG
jgi:Asp-tRNA(Asn)/Glu-tRNA(Gln) amidotransferase A subunit family amidase